MSEKQLPNTDRPHTSSVKQGTCVYLREALHKDIVNYSKCCFHKCKVVADVTTCLLTEARGEKQSQGWLLSPTWLKAEGAALPEKHTAEVAGQAEIFIVSAKINHFYLFWRGTRAIWHCLWAKSSCSWIPSFLWCSDTMTIWICFHHPVIIPQVVDFITVSQRYLLFHWVFGQAWFL